MLAPFSHAGILAMEISVIVVFTCWRGYRWSVRRDDYRL
jgi:hypothetical protein